MLSWNFLAFLTELNCSLFAKRKTSDQVKPGCQSTERVTHTHVTHTHKKFEAVPPVAQPVFHFGGVGALGADPYRYYGPAAPISEPSFKSIHLPRVLRKLSKRPLPKNKSPPNRALNSIRIHMNTERTATKAVKTGCCQKRKLLPKCCQRKHMTTSNNYERAHIAAVKTAPFQKETAVEAEHPTTGVRSY